MNTFCIQLAGIPIEVQAAYNSTIDFCKEYLTGEIPLFSVTITKADIDKMREQEKKTAFAEGRMPFYSSDSYLETLALACVLMEKLIDYHILLCHGSVMAINGKAYLFTAKSGTGKTTHCKLWLEHIPDCHILNGDKPLLLFKDGKVFACGSPWQGKENYGINEILPLEAICILTRNEINYIDQIPFKDCFDTLVKQIHIPCGNGFTLAAFNLIGQLSSMHLYQLGCNMESEAAMTSYKGMVENLL